jgi:hypothetical protein
MEVIVVSLLVWAGQGILSRVGDDLLDAAYADLKEAGRPLLDRLLSGLRSSDEPEVEKAAVLYAEHLRQNPSENEVVLAATISALGAEPIELFDAVVKAMWETVVNLETTPRGIKSGCAAFGGSFPNTRFVTVFDARNWRGGMQELLGRNEIGSELCIWFGYSTTDFPRLWILEVPEERSAEEWAAHLNEGLLDKHDNRGKFEPIGLDRQLRKEQGEMRMWQVSAVFDDRVDIVYPGQVKELLDRASAESLLDTIGVRTETDILRERERRLFDIADTRGTEGLIASIAKLRSGDSKSKAQFRDDLARLAAEVRTAMGDAPG